MRYENYRQPETEQTLPREAWIAGYAAEYQAENGAEYGGIIPPSEIYPIALGALEDAVNRGLLVPA